MFDKFHSLRMMLAYLFRVGLTPDQAGGSPLLNENMPTEVRQT